MWLLAPSLRKHPPPCPCLRVGNSCRLAHWNASHKTECPGLAAEELRQLAAPHSGLEGLMEELCLKHMSNLAEYRKARHCHFTVPLGPVALRRLVALTKTTAQAAGLHWAALGSLAMLGACDCEPTTVRSLDYMIWSRIV
jgi:hypothetical protein